MMTDFSTFELGDLLLGYTTGDYLAIFTVMKNTMHLNVLTVNHCVLSCRILNTNSESERLVFSRCMTS